MNSDDLLKFLPPLPSPSDRGTEHPADQQTASPERVIFTKTEFEDILSGSVDFQTSSLLPPSDVEEIEIPQGEALTEGELAAYSETAALRYTYSLDTLTPSPMGGVAKTPKAYSTLNSPQRDQVFGYLSGRSDVVSDARGHSRWMLHDNERTAVLERLYASGRIEEVMLRAMDDAKVEKAEPLAVQANSSVVGGDVERRLWEYLSGTAPSLGTQDRRNLEITHRVAAWLGGLRPLMKIPSSAEVGQQLARETLLQPFRHLTGEWRDGSFASLFTGRDYELRRIYDYLAVVPPKSFSDRIQRDLRAIADTAWRFVTRSAGERPLLIYGPGGVGKSTLLAEVLLDHLTLTRRADAFPYAYLDFDLSALNAREPLTLLAEAGRQLAIQYPSSSTRWEAARNKWLEETRILGSFRISALDEFTNLLLESEIDNVPVSDQFRRGLPFLMVFDTVEEIQYSDRDGIKDIFRLLNILRDRLHNLRVILMGRAPVTDLQSEFADIETIAVEADSFGTGAMTDFEVIEVRLGDLSEADAKTYLQRQGVQDYEVAEDLVNVVGGNPLILRLIARVIRDGTLDVKSLRQESEWKRGLGDWLRGRTAPPKTILQGVLFKRILGHIHDKEIRKIAHPGLVLRRINAELIRDVLAGPCELGRLTDQQAEDYFQRLAREVALVGRDPNAPGEAVIRHRPELRLMMLRLMAADGEQREKIQQVHENAVQYYARRTGRAAREEELYHRLMLGTPPRVEEFLDDVSTEEGIEAGYARRPQSDLDVIQIWYSLVKSVEELPIPSVAYLDARLKSDIVPEAEWARAHPADWELMTLGKASRRARERAHIVSALEGLRRDVLLMRSRGVSLSEYSPLALMEFALMQRLAKSFEDTSTRVFTTQDFFRHPRREVEYNVLLARGCAERGETELCRNALEAALKTCESAKSSSLANGIGRCTRQLVRTAALCQNKRIPASQIVVAALSTLNAETLKAYPALLRFAVGSAISNPECRNEIDRFVRDQDLLPVLLASMETGLASEVRYVFDGWWRSLPAELIAQVFKSLDSHLAEQLRQGHFESLLQLREGRTLSSVLPPVLMDVVFNSAESLLAELSRAWMGEWKKAAIDAFREAHRAGELIVGEEPPIGTPQAVGGAH